MASNPGRIQRLELINAMSVLATHPLGRAGEAATDMVRQAYATQRKDFAEVAQASLHCHALVHVLQQIGQSRSDAQVNAGMMATGSLLEYDREVGA